MDLLIGIEHKLNDCLKRYRKEFDEPKMVFRDIGIKDIYQVQLFALALLRD